MARNDLATTMIESYAKEVDIRRAQDARIEAVRIISAALDKMIPLGKDRAAVMNACAALFDVELTSESTQTIILYMIALVRAAETMLVTADSAAKAMQGVPAMQQYDDYRKSAHELKLAATGLRAALKDSALFNGG